MEKKSNTFSKILSSAAGGAKNFLARNLEAPIAVTRSTIKNPKGSFLSSLGFSRNNNSVKNFWEDLEGGAKFQATKDWASQQNIPGGRIGRFISPTLGIGFTGWTGLEAYDAYKDPELGPGVAAARIANLVPLTLAGNMPLTSAIIGQMVGSTSNFEHLLRRKER